LARLRFSFFRFEPTCKVLRIFGLRLHQPSHQIRPDLADRAEPAVKTRPNSRALIEWRGYFRNWGTFRTWRDVRLESAFGGNAEVAFQGREDRLDPKRTCLRATFAAKMISLRHYQADDLMKSIKARSGAGTSRRPG
jgi:hypothetical protein